MKAFMYTFFLQTKTDLKQFEILIVYYLVPLVFYIVMGFVFQSIMPDISETLIATMSIFAISMGALFGLPSSIFNYCQNTLRKSLRVSSIPLSAMIFSGMLSAFVHLMVTTLIIVFVSPILFQAQIPISLLSFFFVIVLLLITSCLLGIIIALFSKSSGRLALYAQIVFLPTVMLSGIMFSVDLLPDGLKIISNIIPGKHAMDLLTSSGSELFSYLYFLIVICVTSLVIALRLRKLRFDND